MTISRPIYLLTSLLLSPFLFPSTSTASQILGYECDGSAHLKNGQLNGPTSADQVVCCVGDPNHAINLANGGPSSCTAGKETPLTALSQVSGGTATTAAATGTGTGTVSSGSLATACIGCQASQTAAVGNGAGLMIEGSRGWTEIAVAVGAAIAML